jgi:hypothetical protein
LEILGTEKTTEIFIKAANTLLSARYEQ